MAFTWWEKGLWQICMHHWIVYGKVDFPKFPPDTHLGVGLGVGYIPQLFDPELRNEVKNFSNLRGVEGFHSTTFSSWTQKWKIYIDIFYGVSCNINHITTISNLYFQ